MALRKAAASLWPGGIGSTLLHFCSEDLKRIASDLAHRHSTGNHNKRLYLLGPFFDRALRFSLGDFAELPSVVVHCAQCMNKSKQEREESDSAKVLVCCILNFLVLLVLRTTASVHPTLHSWTVDLLLPSKEASFSPCVFISCSISKTFPLESETSGQLSKIPEKCLELRTPEWHSAPRQRQPLPPLCRWPGRRRRPGTRAWPRQQKYV